MNGISTGERELITSARKWGFSISGNAKEMQGGGRVPYTIWQLVTTNGTIFESCSFERYCIAVAFMQSVPLGKPYQTPPIEPLRFHGIRAALPQKKRMFG